ncbi:Carbonic anhydrase, gamma class [hydrothermal vent metagenome]|uniref:Carbonic anhydrase, gamma class n=1 Tax=hydrothermal vent metagenome TaxID=652676 RepID=A0A3B1CPH4_9ZZZZ
MIQSFLDIFPTIPSSVFIAPSADVIGDVVLGEESSVWFGTVIRGDVHYIRIGARTNIQDLSMLHVTRKTHPLVIGNEVTVGHHVTLHGCTVKDRVLVGMGAVILDGAVVGENAMVGAGALVTQGMEIPPGSLAFGNPAKVRRPLKPEELSFLSQSAQNYVDLAGVYLSASLSKIESQ